MSLTSIQDRLTPSVPIELTFGAQIIATGRKFTTLFGHKAATGGTGVDYAAYNVVNVGDPVTAKAEVDALAGTGSQIGKMAEAFIKANSAKGGSNFPAFRVVLIPYAQTGFGPSDEALATVMTLRSDMFVSCYPASGTTNLGKLTTLAAQISGPDRDLIGQFGSFVTVGALDALATAEAFNVNSQYALVAYLQDTNTASVTPDGDTTSGSKILTNLTSTAGVHIGATLSGTGIAAGSVVTAFDAVSITMSLNATSTNTSEVITVQNVVSQAAEIVAAAHAGAMMASVFPYVPLQGVVVGGLVPPQKKSDYIQIDPAGSSEAVLVSGLSPLIIQSNGSVALLRTRTTWTMVGLIPKTSYFDWQDLVVMNDFREDVFLITQNPPFNNNPGGAKATQTLASFLKDEILRQAQAYEDLSAFQGVQALAKFFLVQPSTTSRGRFDFKIPVNVVPGNYVIAGNIQGVTTFDFTL